MAMPGPPHLPPGERMRRAGIAAWSVIGILILGAILFWLLLKIRIVFPPLVLALLIIYLLNPIVTRLEGRGVPRGLGAVLTYVVILGGITLLVIALIPRISNQVETFSEQWPGFRDKMVEFVDDTADSIERRFDIRINTERFSCLVGADETETTGGPSTARCDAITERFREQITSSAGRLTEIGFTILEGLLVFILAPLIALYLLIDLPQLRRDVLNLVPEASRAEFSDVGAKIARALGGFFRGQLMVAVFVGAMSALGFWIIKLPFWLVIGAIAGFFNLVPLIGPFIGGGIGFLVGTVSGGVGLGVKAALVELIVQQVDNHLITPNVMKRTVQLHPATVMLGLLAGGAVAGFWGVLLAVPGIATTKILLGHFWLTRVLGEEPTPFARSVPARGSPDDVRDDHRDDDGPDPPSDHDGPPDQEPEVTASGADEDS
jgi:predicted PurR-regulated permease PerM